MACDASAPVQTVWLASQREMHVLTGEDAEFTALVRRQSGFVFRVAYAVLLNAHDAEDAVQETFLKLYRHGGWRHVRNERAFLARAAWRVAVDARRRAAPEPATAASQAALETDGAPSPLPGPDEILLYANQHALVHSMIDALPEDLRVPLVLSSFEELNSCQIARILGIPKGTVRTRLQRARQVLRRKLAGLEEARHA